MQSFLSHFSWLRLFWARFGLRVVVLTLAGFALLACMLQSEFLLVSSAGAGEMATRWLYRLSFLIVLPFRLLVSFVIPRHEHHWPLVHFMVACMGTPWFLFGLFWTVRRGLRRFAPPMEERLTSGGGISRRTFMQGAATASFTVAAGGAVGYGTLIEPERLMLREYELPIRGLPSALDGLRIVHLSDTHYGPYTPSVFIEEAIERANALQPDLILLTGDYVHFTPRAIEPGIGLLSNLRARLGVAATLGNHDHWEGVESCRGAFKRLGIPLVDNSRLFLTPDGLRDSEALGRCLCIAGLGDLWEDRVLFEAALGGIHANTPRILLSHNPDAAEMIPAAHRVDAMLSGHTHGGQIRLPVIGAPVSPSIHGAKYLGGMCFGPRCPVIVSRGIGLAGVPIRFGVPPEIGSIALRSA